MTALADRSVSTDPSRSTGRFRLVIGAALMAIYLVASFGSDSSAFLSTDTGGKAATLEAMVENDSWQPDLGYWAEHVDPDGSLYPMFGTNRIGDQWVNVTSLPMLLLARPLYAIGGYRLALLIPMTAAAAAALLAAELAKRLGSERLPTTWVIGLASPVAVYALDLWEHSLGLALMLGAIVLAVDLGRGERTLFAAVGVGLLFGAASAMRQEALVYGFVTGVVASIAMIRSSGLVSAALRGSAIVIGLAVATAANSGLERLIFGTAVRAERSTATLSVGGRRTGERLTEAAITGAGPFSTTDSMSVAFAALLAGSLLWLGVASVRRWPMRPPVVIVGAIYLMVGLDLVMNGLRFVPGLLATAPLAALGIVAGVREQRLRLTAAIAIGSLPLIWAVQFLGGAAPQWGGRYLLCSMVLLVVQALVGFDGDRRVLLGLTAVGAVMSLLSVAWLVERTHAVAATMDDIAALPEEVVVFSDPFVPREAGSRVIEEQWLVASGSEQRSEASAVLQSAAIETFVFIDLQDRDASTMFVGFRARSITELDFLGSTMTLTSFEADR